MIATKFVVTIGPASNQPEMLASMIETGVNVFRLNFSHGTLAEHQAALEHIRSAAKEQARFVAVMGDLGGPKIRLGRIQGGQCELVAGRQVVFQREEILGSPERLWCSYPAFVDDVHVDQRVLIDDGNVRLRASEVRPNEIVCRCEIGGTVSDRKGINLPDTEVSAPSLTTKDETDLAWAIAHDLDFVALSFVRHPDDLRRLRGIIEQHHSPLHVVSKIEKPAALQHLDEIVCLSDAVMVARGDLGVEMDLARVPVIQKEIALMCQAFGKPVIIATQMLQSMVDSPVPTRAEVSDVANAILDRADAVMLSAETSIGKYPMEAIRLLRRVAEQTEGFEQHYGEVLGANRTAEIPVARAIVRGASVIARELKPPLVAIWTESGETAILLSKHRLPMPILALAPHERVCRQLSLSYGIHALQFNRVRHHDEIVGTLDQLVLERKLAAAGESIVVVADTRPDVPGETDALFIHVVGSTKSA